MLEGLSCSLISFSLCCTYTVQLNLKSHIEFETRAKSGQLYPTLENKIKVAPFLCQLRGCYLVNNFNFCNEYRLQIIDTLVYNIC